MTYKRDIVGAFKGFAGLKAISRLSPARPHMAICHCWVMTAPFAASLRAGIASYERLFGRKPPRHLAAGMRLPFPPITTKTANCAPALNISCREAGIKLFFSETHLITGGAPVGVAAGEAIGPYGEIKRRYLVPMSSVPHAGLRGFDLRSILRQRYHQRPDQRGTQRRFHHRTQQRDRPARMGARIGAIPAILITANFTARMANPGMQYWRVTGPKVDLGDKGFLSSRTGPRTKSVCTPPDFVGLVQRIHQARRRRGAGTTASSPRTMTPSYSVTGGLRASTGSSKFCADWLESDRVDLVTASRVHRTAFRPKKCLHVPEGSWGMGGNHFTWSNIETEWMWPPLFASCRKHVIKALANPA